MAAFESKDVLSPVSTTPSVPGAGAFSRAFGIFNAYQQKRDALGLPNPGTVEHLAREVQSGVLLTNLSFSGLRADVTKAFSTSPMFQISHALSMGGQGAPYVFAGIYGTNDVFMQGTLDSDFSANTRFHYRWSPSFVSKFNVQIQGAQAIFQAENDYTGADFSASLKALNPSILDGGLTGIFIGDYLQSVTSKLALGIEGVWQRQGISYGPDCLLSYVAKYRGKDWIASAQILAQGGVQASYWKRLTDKVETGVDVNLQFAGLSGSNAAMMGGPRTDGSATIGAKYDFRQSSFRAQVDSTGKVGALLEKSIAQAVRVTFAGEIDHAKNAAKVGLAVSLESAGDEVLEQQEAFGSNPPQIPF